ncbi:MAG: phosphoribosylformylglycinamidine synthase I [Euryarchaeota archaeon]|nr:phosphoribosylformylglycinamidine synthase I [Euryarchaeota archaeon]
MRLAELRVLVLRSQGTNCDAETAHSIRETGAGAEVVHVNKLLRGRRSLEEFHALVLPGGFSYGDRIRSGAVLAKLLASRLRRELQSFVEEGKPVLGICNGFQVLIETGLLPFGEVGEPMLALAKNASARFEARWVHLLRGAATPFTEKLPRVSRMPVANAEGRVVLPLGREQRLLEELEENNQIPLRYCSPQGALAHGEYPLNPSGSFADIAAIATPEGNVMGMMPHPERAFHRYMYPDWTRNGAQGKGDGYRIFQGMLEYAAGRL